MKTKLLLLLIISTFLLASCASHTYVCPDGSTAQSISACVDKTNVDVIVGDDTAEKSMSDESTTGEKVPKPSDNTFTLDEKELASIVALDDYEYLAAPEENQFGDKSSIRNIAGTKKYEANMQATINYAQTSKYKDTTLFVKILGTGISGDLTEVVFDDYLWPGEQTFDFSTILATQAESPRLKFCFGFTPDFDPFFEEDENIACFTKRLDGPVHRLFISKTTLDFSFDRYEAEEGDVLEVSKSIQIKNDGTVPTTFFAYVSIPEEEYDLKVSDESFLLNPGQEKTITYTGIWNYDGTTIMGREYSGIYTVGHSCEPTKECFDGARVRESIEINYHN